MQLVEDKNMQINDLNHFLSAFFTMKSCEILHNTDGILTIQLTEEMDKALMNRPFYWHYIRNTQEGGTPMQLTLITNPDRRDEKGEWIHFGSPRLQQIMNYLKMQEMHTKLFETVHADTNTPLYPWLLTNIKINYKGKQKKEEIFSIGLQLVNGTMLTNMMEKLEERKLSLTISDYCYQISPMIKLESGFSRIEKVIENYLTAQKHDWANLSIEAMQEEINMAEHFYTIKDIEHENALEKEISEIKERYEPEINIQVINGGMIYLATEFNSA